MAAPLRPRDAEGPPDARAAAEARRLQLIACVVFSLPLLVSIVVMVVR